MIVGCPAVYPSSMIMVVAIRIIIPCYQQSAMLQEPKPNQCLASTKQFQHRECC
jgi:hypothetical protein